MDWTGDDLSKVTALLQGSVTYSIVVDPETQESVNGTLAFPDSDANCSFEVDFDEGGFDPQTGGTVVIRLWGPYGVEAEKSFNIDAEPYVTIADANPIVKGDTAYFPVYLSAPVTGGIDVGYCTQDGTAIAGIDYQGQATTDAPVEFDDGEVMAMIGVATFGSQTGELPAGPNSKTFTVELDLSYQPPPSDGQATGTIENICVDLDTDSNNDGWIDPDNTAAGADDPIETDSPGRCLAVYTGSADELAEVVIRPVGFTPSQSGQVNGKLTFTGGITVWADSDGTDEITSGTSWDLYNPSAVPAVVYVASQTPGTAWMTWAVYAGAAEVASDTVGFSLLESTLTVTNMAPLTIGPSQILQDPYVIVSIQGGSNARGGDLVQEGGNWKYKPHGTTYGTADPWDPFHPYGVAPATAPMAAPHSWPQSPMRTGKN